VKIETTAESLRGAFKNALKLPKSDLTRGQFVRITNGEMYATDLDTWSISNFPATGKGDMLLPYKQTIKVLEGESGPLTIEFVPKTRPEKNPRVKLAIKETEFTLDSQDVTKFPVCPPNGKHTTVINGEDFLQLIDRVSIAISTEETRYAPNGALLKVHDRFADFVATDGHRLSVVTTTAQGDNLHTLIRAEAIRWLKTNIGADVALGTSEEWTTFRTDSLILITKPMRGSFPKYEDVIPKLTEESTLVSFSSGNVLAKSLARAAKCADRSAATTWEFDGDSNTATIGAKNLDTGISKTKVPCSISGPDVEIRLNTNYVLDMLKVAGDVPVNIGLEGPQSPALFTVGNDWKYVVMPMRI
jgi:DNA polymerase-3 subunit beta